MVNATSIANSAAAQNAPTDVTTTGNFEKDANEASTDAKFGEVMKRLQTQYGAKVEKPREAKKTLGKDDFLRIMITQMQHQDPTNPFKAEQMAQEMAQFTSVEQFQNMNRSLDKMTSKDQPLERLAMTNLIGKEVTIDRGRFPHNEGQNESLGFNLNKDASSVKIALLTDSGETILEKDMGPQKAGEGSYSWDGLKKNSLPAKSGTYLLRVEALDEKGQHLETNSSGKARVVGVSFEGAEPVFIVGDASHQTKVTMRNVVRIDDPAMTPQQGRAPGGLGTPAAANAPASSPMFSFQKGVGSSSLDTSQAPPEVAEAIAKYQQAAAANAKGDSDQARAQSLAPKTTPAAEQAKAAQNAVASMGADKGFPNGLQE
jgi:flagellar basal-body rod modification protein FlgD